MRSRSTVFRMPPPPLPPRADKRLLKRRLARELVASRHVLDNGVSNNTTTDNQDMAQSDDSGAAKACADCACALDWDARSRARACTSASISTADGDGDGGGSMLQLEAVVVEPSSPFLLPKYGVVVCEACATVHRSAPAVRLVHLGREAEHGDIRCLPAREARRQLLAGKEDLGEDNVLNQDEHLAPLIAVSLRREYALLSLRQLGFAANAGNDRQNDMLEYAVNAEWAMRIPEALSPLNLRADWIAAKYSGTFLPPDSELEVLEDEEDDVQECIRLLKTAELSEDEADDEEMLLPAVEQALNVANAEGAESDSNDFDMLELAADISSEDETDVHVAKTFSGSEDLDIDSTNAREVVDATSDVQVDGDGIRGGSQDCNKDSMGTSEFVDEASIGQAPGGDDGVPSNENSLDADNDDAILKMIGDYSSVVAVSPRLGVKLGRQRDSTFEVDDVIAKLGQAPSPPGPPAQTDRDEEHLTAAKASLSTLPQPTDTSLSLKTSNSKREKHAALRDAFGDESRRVQSFKKRRMPSGVVVSWPHSKPSAEILAAAGFFFSPVEGKKDRASCFDCSISLCSWQAQDDPLREHRRIVDLRISRATARASKAGKSTVEAASKADCAFLQNKARIEMRAVLESLMRIPANCRCCECGDENIADASADHGIFLCRACSEAHVDFGVSSEILHLPSWLAEILPNATDATQRPADERPWPRSSLRRFVFLGNSTHREIWEYKLSAAAQANTTNLSQPNVIAELEQLAENRPRGASATFDSRRAWLATKYAQRSFALPHNDRSQSVFFTNVLQAHGADVLEYLVECFSEQADEDNMSDSSTTVSVQAPLGRRRRATTRRALKKSGWLTKHGHGVRSWRKKNRRQWWVLRDNFLFAYADENDTHALKALSLLNATVRSVDDQTIISRATASSPHGPAAQDMTCHNFELITPQKTIILHAEGPREQEDWICALDQTIRWLGDLSSGTFHDQSTEEPADAAPSEDLQTPTLSLDSDPIREGFLWMCPAGSGKRKRRWAVFHDETIYLFSSAKESSPIASINIRAAVVELDGKVKEHNRGFVLHTHDGGSWDVSCDTSGKTREWVDAIKERAQELARLGAAPAVARRPTSTNSHGGRTSSNASLNATLRRASDRAGAKSAFMHKKGDKSRGGVRWKKRWFVLKNGELSYFKKDSDTVPAGSIGLSTAKARLVEDIGKQKDKDKGKKLFEVITPTRVYEIGAMNDVQRDEWISAINQHAEKFLLGSH